MSLNLKEERKCPWRKNTADVALFADKMETVSSSKAVLDIYLLFDSGEVHQTTGSQCLPQQFIPLSASDSTAFKMILSEVRLAAPINNFNIPQ